MKRKKKSSDFDRIQREVARRLQAGLPLAGMLAATSLLCGCEELPIGRTSGIAPREDLPQCERKSTAPATHKNGQSETDPTRTTGVTAPETEPNRRNESEDGVTSGDVPETPPNRKNESVDPASTMGRYPAKPEKEKK